VKKKKLRGEKRTRRTAHKDEKRVIIGQTPNLAFNNVKAKVQKVKKRKRSIGKSEA